MLENEDWLRILGLLILLMFSALFSGAETSLTSMSVIKVKQLKNRGIKQAVNIERLMKKSHKILATILIGNNIVNIAATAVMVPRIDMIYLEEESSLEASLNSVIDFGYSRIPVIKDTIDNVIGILYAKDLLAYARQRGNNEDFDIKKSSGPRTMYLRVKKSVIY